MKVSIPQFVCIFFLINLNFTNTCTTFPCPSLFAYRDVLSRPTVIKTAATLNHLLTTTSCRLHCYSCNRRIQTWYSWQSESRGCILQWRARYCLSRGFSSLSSLFSTILTAIWISLSAFKNNKKTKKWMTQCWPQTVMESTGVDIQVHRNLLSLGRCRWRSQHVC